LHTKKKKGDGSVPRKNPGTGLVPRERKKGVPYVRRKGDLGTPKKRGGNEEIYSA